MRRFAATIREESNLNKLLQDSSIWYDFDDLSTQTIVQSPTPNVIQVINSKGTIPNMQMISFNGANESINIGSVNYCKSIDSAFLFGASSSSKSDYRFLHQPDTQDRTIFQVAKPEGTNVVNSTLNSSANASAQIGLNIYDESRNLASAVKQLRVTIGRGSGSFVLLYISGSNQWLTTQNNLYFDKAENANLQIELNNTQLFSNTVPASGSSSAADSSNLLRLGPFQGLLAETIVYNRVLTAAEKTLIKDYLTSKWNL
jgi:hypothetical protein